MIKVLVCNFIIVLVSFYIHFVIILSLGKWRSALKTMYHSTIRSKLSLIEYENPSTKQPNEKEIMRLVDQEVPSLVHLEQIYYHLFMNSWLYYAGILFYHHISIIL